MITIKILTNNSCPNSRAFNFPVLASKYHLLKNGIHTCFLWNLNDKAYNCDIIFINSNVFRKYWKQNKSLIFSFLETLQKKNRKIFWFDTTDSTWCTQFEVMPFVNKFLKGQIFKDKTNYLKRFRTGRIYTDTFDQLYNCHEKTEKFPLPEESDLQKIEISWNTCFENYNEKRYSISGKIKNLLRPFIANFANGKIRVSWEDPENERNITVSCRVGASHSRISVAEHRKAIMSKLAVFNVQKGKIPLNQYFRELRNSQIAVSPFGVGEITLRDFEIIICGATLLKPDMSHLETWPELFIPDKTFMAFKWDVSDLEKKIENLINDPEKCRIVAKNAQTIYRNHLSESGIANFAKRLEKIILS